MVNGSSSVTTARFSTSEIRTILQPASRSAPSWMSRTVASRSVGVEMPVYCSTTPEMPVGQSPCVVVASTESVGGLTMIALA